MMSEIKARILADERIREVGIISPQKWEGFAPSWVRGDEMFGDPKILDGLGTGVGYSSVWLRFELDGGRRYGLVTLSGYMTKPLDPDSREGETWRS